MKKKKKTEKQTAVNGEVKNLMEMFEFYLLERQLDKPIEALGIALRDIRIIMQRILLHHFIHLPPEEESRFCIALAKMLANRCTKLPNVTEADRQYFDYCISEILGCFEWAQEIKAEYHEDKIVQETFMLDIPLLRPFDYGLRNKLREISPKNAAKSKKKK
ncbi:MAG: hypothetical protein ABH859_05260 [Pseudomonadota bacterium]